MDFDCGNQISGKDEGRLGILGLEFGDPAQAASCPLYFLGGAIAFHQHHETFDPPLQHLNDIVANVIRYRRKWVRGLRVGGWWHCIHPVKAAV
ncbi:MAG: hypothetical protein GW854_00095 [Erythrobacter sp.]|nr:hypothetical protein [Erythrobacter sp.]